jgi:hypothetical protein
MDYVVNYRHGYHQGIIMGHYDPRASSSEKDSITDFVLAAFIGLCREYM